MNAPRGTVHPAFELLSAELEALDGRFDELAALADGGARRTAGKSLLEAISNYVRLERDVICPALAEAGTSPDPWTERHRSLEAAMATNRSALERDDGDAARRALQKLRSALRAHRTAQETTAFPAAAQALAARLPTLAIELEELRTRLAGSYGV